MTAPDAPDADLLAWLDGELQGEARAAFEARLARDNTLRAEAEGLRATRELLRADTAYGAEAGLDAPPPHLLDAILRAEVLARPPALVAAMAAHSDKAAAGSGAAGAAAPPFWGRVARYLVGGGVVTAAAAVLLVVQSRAPDASLTGPQAAAAPAQEMAPGAPVAAAVPAERAKVAAARTGLSAQGAPARDSRPGDLHDDAAPEPGTAAKAQVDVPRDALGFAGTAAAGVANVEDKDAAASASPSPSPALLGLADRAPAQAGLREEEADSDLAHSNQADATARLAGLAPSPPPPPASPPAPAIASPEGSAGRLGESVGQPQELAHSSSGIAAAPAKAAAPASAGGGAALPQRKGSDMRREMFDLAKKRARSEALDVAKSDAPASAKEKSLGPPSPRAAAAELRGSRQVEQANMTLMAAVRELEAGRHLTALDLFDRALAEDPGRSLGLAPVAGKVRALHALNRSADAVRLAPRLLPGNLGDPLVVEGLLDGALAAERVGDLPLAVRLATRAADKTNPDAALRSRAQALAARLRAAQAGQAPGAASRASAAESKAAASKPAEAKDTKDDAEP